jgi:hypothetical protein
MVYTDEHRNKDLVDLHDRTAKVSERPKWKISRRNSVNVVIGKVGRTDSTPSHV